MGYALVQATPRNVWFEAKTYDVKLVVQLLKAIRFKENAIFFCTPKGIKVTVEDMRCLQANSYLEASLFDEYRVNRPDDENCVKFTANLGLILDCLTILCNSGSGLITALVITYKRDGCPLQLLMEDTGVITDCKIKTFVTDPVMNFPIDSSKYTNKVVLFSDFFKEILNDIDINSDVLEITINSFPAMIKLTTNSHGLVCETHVPYDCEMVDCFYCHTTCKESYKLSLIRPALKPLPGSLKISIQIYETGTLCLQYLIIDDDGRTCFVEYYCSPVYKPEGEIDFDNFGSSSQVF